MLKPKKSKIQMSNLAQFGLKSSKPAIVRRSGQLSKQNTMIETKYNYSYIFFLILHKGRNTWYIGEKSDRHIFICQTIVSMYELCCVVN